MDLASRALALLFLLPALALASRSEKTVYHISVNGSVQLSCKITHKATKTEPYLLVTCVYRCDRPVTGTIDVKEDRENIYCRGVASPSPAAQGETVEAPQDKPIQEEVEDQ